MADIDLERSLAHRRALVATLRREGHLNSRRVAEAFMAVPREVFVPGLPLDQVYRPADAIVVKRVEGVSVSSASAPEVIALMLEQLDVQPGNRVLEIGAGTGYNAALLAQLVGEQGSVVSLDLDEDLVASAREHLQRAGCSQVRVIQADGAQGYASEAPYDRIILTAAAKDIPPAWWQELARPHGRLVLPLSMRGLQRCLAFAPEDDGLLSRSMRMCAFITLRGALGSNSGPRPAYVDGRWVADGDEQSLPISSEVIAELLGQPLKSWRSGVSLSLEHLRHGLQLWLAAHDKDIYTLWATTRLPDLFGLADRIGARGTLCLLGLAQASLAMLAWADEAMHGGEMLVLAPVGAESLGERFVGLLREWAAAGGPLDADAEIRAYPRDKAPADLASGEAAIDQRWTRFVLGWRPRRQTRMQ
jgi:protein-L-isoaspartate(D-aspartate) O-methyltransferase